MPEQLKPTPFRAWIYCRVDSPDAYALSVQQKSLTTYGEGHGYTVAGATVEQCSGITMSRKGLREITKAAEQGFMDVLLVKNLDRLGRKSREVVRFIDKLAKHGVEVICTDDNGSAEGMVKITRHILYAMPAHR